MVDNTYSNKLNELIKQALSNYELTGDNADWERMERILGTVPKASSYNFKDKFQSATESLKIKSPAISLKKVPLSYIVIGVLAVIVSILVYVFVKSHNSSSDNLNNNAAKQVTDSLVNQKKIVPIDSNALKNANESSQQLIDTIENTIPDDVENKIAADSEEVAVGQQENIKDDNTKDEKEADSKKKDDKKNNKKDKKEEELLIKNEPTLPGQLDSLKSPENLQEKKTQTDTTHNTVVPKAKDDSVKVHHPGVPKDSFKVRNR